jgi:hypothetical protein
VCDEVWDEVPAAPIRATPHFVAFFVPRVVVYASSQDFVETALGQPYLNTKGAFMPALYPIPGFSTHPDHIQPHTISPQKPGSAATPVDAYGALTVDDWEHTHRQP